MLTDVTYYIDSECIITENHLQSPYGPWLETVYYKNSTSAYRCNSEDRMVKGSSVEAVNKGVIPVIELDKSKIMY